MIFIILYRTNGRVEFGDADDLKQVELRCNKIIDRLSELISEMEQFKIDKGETPRAARQWKKKLKADFLSWQKLLATIFFQKKSVK